MRIPLDYYRILGVPIQASTEQLQQAYRDRLLQLPRREYSEMAIASRKQLLDEAYAVLSDSEQRSAYDVSFLSKTYVSDALPQPLSTTAATANPDHPSIEINEEQFIGALLILQELGEYELVLKLGSSHLNERSAAIENGKFGEPKIIRADIILTVSLACLELGREQWQQRRYENAAQSLNMGQDLLLREGLFASARGEIQADLFKLRPYRILELLALPEENVQERRSGLLLLREMLQERGGMDGTNDDRSGLSVDDFLRFVQQLRTYLTSAEQQTLFEEESRRPSAVATYLAVYALLARGFTQLQPNLIRRAKLMLIRLGKRQDVYLEQAVCALLLGQTIEASRALELSGEYESLAFIREHSQGSPDLLPGLCLYSERWLQSEVFPHFRDLAGQEVSLKEYFADEQVQTALEALLPETVSLNDWEVMPSGQLTSASSVDNQERGSIKFGLAGERETVARLKSNRTAAFGDGSKAEPVVGSAKLSDRSGGVQTLPAAERISSTPTEGQRQGGVSGGEMPSREVESAPGDLFSQGSPEVESPPPPRGFPAGSSRRGKRLGRPKLNLKHWVSHWRTVWSPGSAKSTEKQKLVILAIASVLGIGLFLFLAVKGISWTQKSFFSGPTLKGEQPSIGLSKPLFTPPKLPENPLAASGPLTKATALKAIDTWLVSKAKAFGSDREIEQLDRILVNPALSRWQNLARDARRSNWYRNYEHNPQSDSLKIIETTPDRAKVEVRVREAAKHYRGNKLIRKESYDSTVRVRYDLVRQNGRWYIKEIRS